MILPENGYDESSLKKTGDHSYVQEYEYIDGSKELEFSTYGEFDPQPLSGPETIVPLKWREKRT